MQRNGSKCYFCELPLEKGSPKLVFDHHRSKPARSIHPGCVFSIDASLKQNSYEALRKQVVQGGLDADARAVCQNAMDILQPTAGLS